MLLSVQNLKRLALGPLNLNVEAGDVVALTGASGAGKSLVLRAIADLDPNSGDVHLNGVVRESFTGPDWRRRVMYVPAHSGWWADKVEPHFQSATRSDVIEVLHRLNLESTALGWEVANLSTGERQRLSFARAVVLNPKILMLDEPTSGLDAENAARVESLILERAEAGMGIIFVSHDAAQVARLGARQSVLQEGLLTEKDLS